MFILKKELLMIACFAMLSSSLYADNRYPPVPEESADSKAHKHKDPYDTKFKLEAYDVEKTIDEFKQKLKAELKGDKIATTVIGTYAYKFKLYSMHPKIEEETEVYKSWYVNVSKCLSMMSKSKANFYSAKASKDMDKMQQCILNYKKALKKCINLIKNPKKIEKGDKKRRSTKKRNN